MKIKFRPFLTAFAFTALFASCKKDSDPVIVIDGNTSKTMILEGLAGSESGANAANSVFVDFSSDQQTSILRSSWDLGFYSGSDFKVVINNTTGASVLQLSKTDLNAVTEADLDVAALTLNIGRPDLPAEFTKLDDPRESNILNKTAIASVSASNPDNKVYLISLTGGTHSGSAITADAVYKIRILRNGVNYTLQYAKLKDVTFKTLDINKDPNYNFSYVSLTQGKTVTVEPKKANWDIEWTWSIYTDAKGTYVYGYSDLVFTNTLNGVQAFQASYADSATAANAYKTFNKDSIGKYTFSSKRDVVGSNWRSTATSPLGVIRNRFYVVKDPSGNYYKLKFLTVGEITTMSGTTFTDGGTRGKPSIQYELIAK